MAEETKQWEYRVQTIGGIFGTKDEQIEATLDQWGMEGWEASTFTRLMEAAKLRSLPNVH